MYDFGSDAFMELASCCILGFVNFVLSLKMGGCLNISFCFLCSALLFAVI